MTNFSTPGVYTEEVPVLPQSVAGVSTAIPAFIGYTEKAVKSGKNATNVAVKISTLLEYKEIFGTAQPTSFSVSIDDNENIQNVATNLPKNKLYYALDMYFKNGGGDCYVISVGSYQDEYTKENFLDGLEILSKEDEPTLIVLGEAANLDEKDYYAVCQEALTQCEELKDRFCIFDVLQSDTDASAFRSEIGNEDSLKYGAAYTPYLQTSLNHVYNDSDVIIVTNEQTSEETTFSIDYAGIRISFSGNDSDNPKFKINNGTPTGPDFTISTANLLTISKVPTEGISAEDIVKSWSDFAEKEENSFSIEVIEATTLITPTSGNASTEIPKENIVQAQTSLADKKGTALYSKITSTLTNERIVLAPSSSIAGVYAKTDRQRGVWKAPANVSLNSVIAPIAKITSKTQDNLNVHETGKSINAIRSFVGKGTLVWGARTLKGNDNEWKYIPVRRLFNFIEESTKKASHFAVFEPNDATTWLKVKAMIESFLYSIWQQGGLAGSTEEQAYFVNIGLGKTMTQQDILDGKMIVEIGLAAVRPAEFIVLKFSHKLQEV